MSATERRLFAMTGEELLMRAIAGRGNDRRRIHQELDLRALLSEGPRRPRILKATPHLAQRHAA